MFQQSSPALTQLPDLQDLAVAGRSARFLYRVTRAVLAGSPALRHVHLACRGVFSVEDADKAPLRDLLRELQAPRLSTFSLRLFDVPSGPPPSLSWFLATQPALTRLHLHWYRNCLALVDEVATLACITALQHLDIHDFRPDPALHAEGAKALRSQTALTELSLTQGGTAFWGSLSGQQPCGQRYGGFALGRSSCGLAHRF